MDQTGPEIGGRGTGRGLGTCRETGEKSKLPETLGLGMAKRRHADDGELPGKGRRLRYFQKKK